jgi:hypothetical protein
MTDFKLRHETKMILTIWTSGKIRNISALTTRIILRGYSSTRDETRQRREALKMCSCPLSFTDVDDDD